jgi:phage shock protein PspC (stress-responsive transcriptional regulator)
MSEHISHTPHVRRLERSSSDRFLAGVSGGLGRYFDLNPAFFRIGFVVLTLLGGAGLLIYLAAVLVMPEEGKDRSIAEQVIAERRTRPWPLAGLLVAGIAIVVLLTRGTFWPNAGAAWFIFLVAGLAIVWVSRGGRRAIRVVRALTVLAVVGLAAAIAAVVLAFAWFNVSLNDGVGDRTYVPTSTAAVAARDYKLGIGGLRVDLTGLGPITKPLRVDARVGIGHLHVVVPRNVPVAIDAHVKAGEIDAPHRKVSGRNADLQTGSGLLTIDANVGAGRIDVERAG